MLDVVNMFRMALGRPFSCARNSLKGYDLNKYTKDHNQTSNRVLDEVSHSNVRLSMHDPYTFAIFLGCAALFGFMITILQYLPPISSVETVAQQFNWKPSTAAHFKLNKELLVRYWRLHSRELLIGMIFVNIMLQTFCVPGSATTINVMAGCLFHEVMPSGEFIIALPFAVLCSTVAALLSYLLSWVSACQIVARRFPSKISWLQQKIAANSTSFIFLLSLRVSPLIPGWLFNIAGPLLPVSVGRFAAVSLLSNVPPSAMCVQIGAMLGQMQEGQDVLRASLPRLLALGVLLFVISTPALLACL